jgi:hypothetical protein
VLNTKKAVGIIMLLVGIVAMGVGSYGLVYKDCYFGERDLWEYCSYHFFWNGRESWVGVGLCIIGFGLVMLSVCWPQPEERVRN